MKRSHSFSPYKKPKLDVQATQRTTNTSRSYVTNDDISTLWDDDFPLHNVEELQQIETQALTQLSVQASRTENSSIAVANLNHRFNTQLNRVNNSISDDNYDLKEQLLTKDGEIKMLRRELDEIHKKHLVNIEKLNNKVKDLERESAAKDSELRFQEQHSLLLQEKKKLSTSVIGIKDKSPICSSKRFSFGETSIQIKNIETVEKPVACHDGELLHNLLAPTLAQLSEIPFELQTSGNNDNNSEKYDKFSTNNKFFSYFGMDLIGLLRFNSFSDESARCIIKRILYKSYKEFYKFFLNIRQKKSRLDATRRIVRESTIYKIDPTGEYSLLSNSKWYAEESSIHLRQTLKMLSILLCIDHSLMELIIPVPDAFQGSLNSKTSNEDPDYKSSLFMNLNPELADIFLRNEEMFKNLHRGVNEFELIIEKKISVLSLMLQIICVLINRNQISFHLGFIAAVINFYESIFRCSRNIIAIDKIYEVIISNSVRQIILNTYEPVLIKCITEFLGSSVLASVNITQNLCHKSAADTFVEDSICYAFTSKTCALQVFCVVIEMMPDSVKFIHSFLKWATAFTSLEHTEANWLHNKTNTKLCECLPSFQLTIIKVVSNCILLCKNDKLSPDDEILLKSSLRLVKLLFTRLKHHDEDYDIHISRYQGQYVQLLNDLRVLFPTEDDIRVFVTEELNRTRFTDVEAVSSGCELDENEPNEISQIGDIRLKIKDTLYNFDLLFENNLHLSYYIHGSPDDITGLNSTKVDNSDPDDNENLSVKDYLQSTLTQSYFKG